MIYAVIGVGLVQIAIALVIFRYMARQKNDVVASLHTFFEPPDEKTPSQFALLLTNYSQVIAGQLSSSLKAAFMGVESANSRQVDGIQADMIKDMAAADHPVLGAIMESFPSLAKRLRKRPEALPLVIDMAGRFLAGRNGTGGKGGGGGTPAVPYKTY